MVRTSGLAVVVALLVVVGLIGVVPTISERGHDAGTTTAGAGSGVAAAQQQQLGDQEFTVTVYPNGSARWTTTYRRPLTNETERRGFEAYAQRFNNEETAVYREFVGLGQQLTRSGTRVTGRRMEARDFSRQANVTGLGNRGVVQESFLWTNFAVVHDNGSVVVGDVFDGGRFVDGLYVGPGQRFVVRQEGIGPVQSVAPTPNASTTDRVSWAITRENGRDFGSGRPRVVFGSTSAGGNSLSGGAIGALLLVLGLAAALAWRFGGVPGTGDSSGGSEIAEGRSLPSPGGESMGQASDTTGEKTRAPPPEPAVADEELLADNDRVRELLEANGGRMRQVSIVEATDWSKSKVSMLLSEMEAEGEVSKLRIGRENIISLDGYGPNEDSRSDTGDERP